MCEPEAIFFDLDDTILDDNGKVDACLRATCDESAESLGLTSAGLFTLVRKEADWYWSAAARHREGRLDLRAATALIVRRALTAAGIEDVAAAKAIANAYRDRREATACLLPGAIETLEHFRSRGVKLAMITNGSGDGQRAKIERFGLAPYFEGIFIEGEFGCGKPERAVYEAALAHVAVAPQAAWMVGDNLEWDVGMPQSLGLFGVWVDVQGSGLPPGANVRPDRTVRSIAELI
jgi:putative hydrolase of the HAD superfamily